MKHKAFYIVITKNEFSPVVATYRRYFAGFTKGLRVSSAWCFAGSKLYSDEKRVSRVAAILQEKGWTTHIKSVNEIPHSPQ